MISEVASPWKHGGIKMGMGLIGVNLVRKKNGFRKELNPRHCERLYYLSQPFF